MRPPAFLPTVLLLVLTGWVCAEEAPRTVRVFVALADNKSQGIIPVPAKIGNGDDASNNLYWGCTEGLRSVFGRSAQWRLVSTVSNPAPAVLERRIYEHRSTKLTLIADAYRGTRIREAITDFFAALTSEQPAAELPLVAYIGHDGLMDFALPEAATTGRSPGRQAIVLCCRSEEYFGPALAKIGARPALLTTQLMYPGAFILQTALEGWRRGESRGQLRERAAASYAANQKISVKAARGVFSAP